MRAATVRGVLAAGLLLGALAAGAETVWVDSPQLAADPTDPRALSFVVEVREPGSYQARVMVRGEADREIQLELSLRPEAGGPARSVRFSFTGQGCG